MSAVTRVIEKRDAAVVYWARRDHVGGVVWAVMPRHLPWKLRPARTASAVLFALLAVALATPALARSAHPSGTKSRGAPSCTHFSRVRIGRLIHVGSLKFEGRTPVDNACTYTAKVPGEYSDLLQVSVIAPSRCRPLTCRAVFLAAEQNARVAAVDGAYFHTVNVRGAKMFDVVDVTIARQSAPPCPPGWKLPEFGPPLCRGAPAWATIAVDSYGALKPTGPKAFVDVSLASEVDVGKPDWVISLNKEILSGQIR